MEVEKFMAKSRQFGMNMQINQKVDEALAMLKKGKKLPDDLEPEIVEAIKQKASTDEAVKGTVENAINSGLMMIPGWGQIAAGVGKIGGLIENKDEFGVSRSNANAAIGSALNPVGNVGNVFGDIADGDFSARSIGKLIPGLSGVLQRKDDLDDKNDMLKKDASIKNNRQADISANFYSGLYSDVKQEFAKGGKVKKKYADGGEVEGPGTGKSDSISTKLEPNSFVVPVENADIANQLGQEYLGWNTGKKAKKGKGVDVKISDGEVIFKPDEVFQLTKLGIDLNSLAPNADGDNKFDTGGAVGSNDPLWQKWNEAKIKFPNYEMGSKASKQTVPNSIDCSGAFCYVNGEYNSLYEDDTNVGAQKIADIGRPGLYNKNVQYDDLSNFQHGDILFLNTGNGRAAHVVQVLVEPDTGELFIAESSDGKGVHISPAHSRVKELQDAATKNGVKLEHNRDNAITKAQNPENLKPNPDIVNAQKDAMLRYRQGELDSTAAKNSVYDIPEIKADYNLSPPVTAQSNRESPFTRFGEEPLKEEISKQDLNKDTRTVQQRMDARIAADKAKTEQAINPENGVRKFDSAEFNAGGNDPQSRIAASIKKAEEDAIKAKKNPDKEYVEYNQSGDETGDRMFDIPLTTNKSRGEADLEQKSQESPAASTKRQQWEGTGSDKLKRMGQTAGDFFSNFPSPWDVASDTFMAPGNFVASDTFWKMSYGSRPVKNAKGETVPNWQYQKEKSPEQSKRDVELARIQFGNELRSDLLPGSRNKPYPDRWVDEDGKANGDLQSVLDNTNDLFANNQEDESSMPTESDEEDVPAVDDRYDLDFLKSKSGFVTRPELNPKTNIKEPFETQGNPGGIEADMEAQVMAQDAKNWTGKNLGTMIGGAQALYGLSGLNKLGDRPQDSISPEFDGFLNSLRTEKPIGLTAEEWSKGANELEAIRMNDINAMKQMVGGDGAMAVAAMMESGRNAQRGMTELSTLDARLRTEDRTNIRNQRANGEMMRENRHGQINQGMMAEYDMNQRMFAEALNAGIHNMVGSQNPLYRKYQNEYNQ